MLRLVESSTEKKNAQRQLTRALQHELGALGRRYVTFRPGAIQLPLYGAGDGKFYFGSKMIREMSKFWNAFGIFHEPARKQHITVEININISDNDTSGFFAKAPRCLSTYLMHSGRIGGGRKGIGQTAFFAWQKPELVAVTDSDGAVRTGIIIAELGNTNLSNRIASFVKSVHEFKAFAAAKGTETSDFEAAAREWGKYRKEFSGRKKGFATEVSEYVSYHGDIVEALRIWRKRYNNEGFRITNSPLIDLLVHQGDKTIEIYEVKTGGGRQSLYTAIGQLIVHSCQDRDAARYLVLERSLPIPTDIFQALNANNISLIRYEIESDDRVKII